MPSLGLFIGLHSVWYWMVQSFAHSTEWMSIKELEENVPVKRHHEYREVISSFFMNTITLVHTCGVMTFGFPKDSLGSLDLFESSSASGWIMSQYAIEFTILLWGLYRNIWNPLERIRKDFLIHHGLTLTMLALSYWSNYTTIGSLVITITNSTNLFFDYFKYGRLTEDIYSKWVSSALFMVMFFLARIHLFGAKVVLPLLYELCFVSFPSAYLQVGIQTTLLCSLYGLQWLWFYKLCGYVLFQTKCLLSHPEVLPMVPDRFLHLFEAVQGITQPILENDDEVDFEDSAGSTGSAGCAGSASVANSSNKDTSTQENIGEILPEIEEEPNDKSSTIDTHLGELETVHQSLQKGIEDTLSQWRTVMAQQLDLFKKDAPNDLELFSHKKNV